MYCKPENSSDLVLIFSGYLEAEKCPEAALLFLQTSQHLKECHAFYLQNRRFSTKVMGLTLLQCLDYLCSVYRTGESNFAVIEQNLWKVTYSKLKLQFF